MQSNFKLHIFSKIDDMLKCLVIVKGFGLQFKFRNDDNQSVVWKMMSSVDVTVKMQLF
jgi:hypothetical protein